MHTQPIPNQPQNSWAKSIKIAGLRLVSGTYRTAQWASNSIWSVLFPQDNKISLTKVAKIEKKWKRAYRAQKHLTPLFVRLMYNSMISDIKKNWLYLSFGASFYLFLKGLITTPLLGYLYRTADLATFSSFVGIKVGLDILPYVFVANRLYKYLLSAGQSRTPRLIQTELNSTEGRHVIRSAVFKSLSLGFSHVFENMNETLELSLPSSSSGFQKQKLYSFFDLPTEIVNLIAQYAFFDDIKKIEAMIVKCPQLMHELKFDIDEKKTLFDYLAKNQTKARTRNFTNFITRTCIEKPQYVLYQYTGDVFQGADEVAPESSNSSTLRRRNSIG